MDTSNMRFREHPGLPHVVKVTDKAKWEVTNEFKRDGGKMYCVLQKTNIPYEYTFFFSNKRNVKDWLIDVKGPKMPRWLLTDEIYQEVKFKTLDIKDILYGRILFIRNADSYKELKNG